jgi:predicted TIM-barrel fold metal-dependent hydrolase
MVGRAVRRWGFRGIKVHGRDAMPTREVCEVARAFHLPLLVDVIGQAHVVDMLAPQYPDVAFIIPHLGSFSGDWRAHQQVVDQMARHANVFGDTSGVYRFDYLVQAVKRAGPEKLLFGSDGPWLHPAVELHKVRLLGLSPQDEALVCGGNIARLMSRVRVNPEVRPELVRATARPGPTAAVGNAIQADPALAPPSQADYQL